MTHDAACWVIEIRAFPVTAAQAWNALPSSVRSVPSAIAAAVPPRPQDGTVLVIVLFTIVSSCVTDCNFYYCKVPL